MKVFMDVVKAISVGSQFTATAPIDPLPQAFHRTAAINCVPPVAAVLIMLALPVFAETMHVRYVTATDSEIAMIGDDVYLESGQTYSTQTAPAVDGYIFTGWSIDMNGDIDARDRHGRAREVATFSVSEKLSEDYTTVYANYVPASQDLDEDNIPDGWEVYWYGDLTKDGASDTDGDGLTFAEELAAGLDPHMPDETLAGNIAYLDGALLQYNPDRLLPYAIGCEPEGTLFATVSDYLAAGRSLPVPSVSAANSTFAFWMVNGVERRDRHGRAIEALSVTMPADGAVEVVAVCEADANRRAGLYWYGREVAMDDDSDGDGLTFAEELAAGLDPHMPDETLAGNIVYLDGNLLQYNPDNMWPYVVRSDPESALFATHSDYIPAGQIIPIPSFSDSNGILAFWAVNGVGQRDRHGRAVDAVAIPMPEHEIDVVAVCETDANRRAGLYWYGREVAMDDDSDGDGLTFADELAAGLDPLMPDDTLAGGIVFLDGILLEVDLRGGAASVPEGWFDEVVALSKLGIDEDEYRRRFVEKFGSDLGEALLQETGKINASGQSYKVWQEYVLGTDPLDENDKFVAKLTMENGVPVVRWEPELSDEQAAKRKYTIHGKAALDGEWADVTDMSDTARKDAGYRFFKVSVELR